MSHIPRSEKGVLPEPLGALFNEERLQASYPQLLEAGENAFKNISFSSEQARSLEVMTRGQSQCKLWYQYRAGRSTTSKFKDAVHTDATQPSQSLIMRVCYPESFKFRTQSTCYWL